MEQLRQRKWDGWLSQRPKCADCRREIAEEKCLPVPEGLLCPGCIRRRMIPVEVL